MEKCEHISKESYHIIDGVRLKVPDEIIPLLNEEEMKKFISFKESSKLRDDGYLEVSVNMIVDFSIFILEMKKKYSI